MFAAGSAPPESPHPIGPQQQGRAVSGAAIGSPHPSRSEGALPAGSCSPAPAAGASRHALRGWRAGAVAGSAGAARGAVRAAGRRAWRRRAAGRGWQVGGAGRGCCCGVSRAWEGLWASRGLEVLWGWTGCEAMGGGGVCVLWASRGWGCCGAGEAQGVVGQEVL